MCSSNVAGILGVVGTFADASAREGLDGAQRETGSLSRRQRRLWLLTAWLLGVLVLTPLIGQPLLIGALIGAIVAIYFAWKSVAYPLAASAVPPLVDAIFGSDPLPKGGFTFLFAVWTTLAVLFAIAKSRRQIPSAALMSAPVLLSFLLLGLMLLRLGPSLAEEYGSTKLQLYIADTLSYLIGALFVGYSRKDLKLFLNLIFAILAGGALLFVADLLSGSARTVVPGRFSLAAQEYPIYLARASADGILIAIYFFLASTRARPRFWAAAMSPALLVAMLAAGSRGPVLAFAFGLMTLVGLAAASPQVRRRLIGVAGVMLIAVAVVPLVVPASSVSRALSTILGTSTGLSSNGRAELWAAALAAFSRHPLVGVGWGGFAAISPSELYPHNLLLESAVELGVLGLASVVGIIGGMIGRMVAAWRAALGTEKLEFALLISLLMTSIVNALISGAIQDNSEVWLWGGLGIAASTRLVRDVPSGLPAWRERLPTGLRSDGAGR